MTIIDTLYIVPRDLTNTPTGLGAVRGSPPETELDISWNAVVDVNGAYPAGYKVIRDGVVVQTLHHNTLAWANSGLSEAISYDYQIASTDRYGNISTLSSVVTLATKDSTAPTVPTFLTVINGNPPATVLDLDWTASVDNSGFVSSYLIYRDGVGSPLEILAGSPLSPPPSEYSNTGLAPSTEYSYQVSSRDLTGNESDKSGAVYATTTYDAPSIDFRFSFLDYYSNSSMSISDSFAGTMSFWFYSSAGMSDNRIIFTGHLGSGSTVWNATAINVHYNAGDIILVASDATGNVSNVRIDANTITDAPAIYGRWLHVLMSWDTATSYGEAYINGLDAHPSTQILSASNRYSLVTEWQIGYCAQLHGIGSWKEYPEHLAEFWFDPTTSLDITDKAVRDKFYNADSFTPVYLGDTGQLPTGSTVPIYMTSIGSPSTWGDNLGDGGSFTQTGTIDAGNTPVVGSDSVPWTDSFTLINGVDIGAAAWTTVDISTYDADVPPHAVIAVMCANDFSTIALTMGVDEVGGTDTATIQMAKAPSGGVSTGVLWVQLDSLKKARMKVGSVSTAAKFYILGWFGKNVGYNRVDSSDTHTGSTNYERMTMSNHSANGVATVRVGNPNLALNINTMMREVGNTDTYDFIDLNDSGSLPAVGDSAEWFSRTINLDSNKQFDVYARSILTTAYIESYGELTGLTYYPAPADHWNVVEDGAIATFWQTWNMRSTPLNIPVGAVVEVVVTNLNSTSTRTVGVRSTTVSTDNWLALRPADTGLATTETCATFYATVDRDSEIEIYTSNSTDTQFRIAGWFR